MPSFFFNFSAMDASPSTLKVLWLHCLENVMLAVHVTVFFFLKQILFVVFVMKMKGWRYGSSDRGWRLIPMMLCKTGTLEIIIHAIGKESFVFLVEFIFCKFIL